MIRGLVCLCLLSSTVLGQQGPAYFISVPNLLKVGTEETVSVNVFNVANPVRVKVYLQDYPDRKTTFSQAEVDVSQDEPSLVTVRVNPDNLPESRATKRYVYVVAKSDDPQLTFQKEAQVLLSNQQGYVFVQTDKPIYTPNQKVKMRIMPLDQDMTPASQPVKLEILNPQGIIVERKTFPGSATGFIAETFDFPAFPLFGNWTAIAHYGPEMQLNVSTQFEVREYVLPTYGVRIIPSNPYILPEDDVISGEVEALYTYGKGVDGFLDVKFGIVDQEGNRQLFAQLQTEVNDGFGFYEIDTQRIKDLDLWFPEGSRLYLEASVTEEAGGLREMAVLTSVRFETSPFKIGYDLTAAYFKPGLPFLVKLTLTYPDTKPAEDIPVRVSATAIIPGQDPVVILGRNNEHNSDTTNQYGQASFTVDVPPGTQTLTVTAKTEQVGLPPAHQAQEDYEATPYQSPSGSYLLVRVLQRGPIPVDEAIDVEAVVTKQNDIQSYNYMVVTRGQVTLQGKIVRQGGVLKTITFRTSAVMAPISRLIVYYINLQGEVVADSTLLEVENVCRNKVTVSSTDNVEPQEQANIEVNADPNSLVGLLAVDQAVYLLNNYNRLTSQKMFQAMAKYDQGCGPGGGQDSANVFKDAGVTVLTNTQLSPAVRSNAGCASQSRRKRDLQNSLEAKVMEYNETLQPCCMAGQKWDPLGRSCLQRAKLNSTSQDECYFTFLTCCNHARSLRRLGRGRGRMGGGGGLLDIDIDEDESQLVARTEFPETWIFEDVQVDDGGHAVVPVTVPGSITTWIIQAVGISTTNGMCVAKPFRMKSFKKFFIHLQLPYSIIRGEQVAVRATIFNYDQQDLRVNVYLQGVEGVCSGARAGERSERKTLFIKGNDAASVLFPIIPLEVGTFPIRVLAFSTAAGGDIVEKSLQVIPEGVERRLVRSIFVDPKGRARDRKREGEEEVALPTEHDVDPDNGLQFDVVDVRLPPETIEGSEQCAVSVMGDIMGPTITTTIGGLGTLLRLPTGCGEQTMIKLAPNVYVLSYLHCTDQITKDVEEKAYDFIRQGYNRQLTHRRAEGCFSVWGQNNRYPCSTWLTAFVNKVFCQAKKFVTSIDEEAVCKATEWLLSTQREDGAFKEVYKVHHREMTGGVQGDASMTAFVLISLLENCECPIAERSIAIERATLFLERQLDKLKRPYVIAIVTYALHLADSPVKAAANEKLRSIAKYDEGTNSRYWEADASSLGGGQQPYWYTRKPSAIAVETTAYALLTQMHIGDVQYSNPIVVWLTQQRNSAGGFVSTQDTVVALQALASYCGSTKVDPTQFTCQMTSDNDLDYNEEIHVDEDNALIKQEKTAPVGGKLFLSTSGTGIGQMQVEVRYHTPDVHRERCLFEVVVTTEEAEGPVEPEEEPEDGQEGDEDYPDYDGELDARERSAFSSRSRIGGFLQNPRRSRIARQAEDDDQSQFFIRVRVCTSYRGQRAASNMAIMDIGMFSGFEPVKQDLEQLLNRAGEKAVQRYETTNRAVLLYFDEITSEEICVSIRLKRVMAVGAVQPVPVSVYDYYQPDDACTTFYHPSQGSPLLATLCEGSQCVCAEGKCPKETSPKKLRELTQRDLEEKACNDLDYAFRVIVMEVREEGSFDRISVIVESPIKKGLDDVFEGEERVFWKRKTCSGLQLVEGTTYLLMGKDGTKYTDENGLDSFRYVITEQSFVAEWPTGDKAARKKYKRVVDKFQQLADKIFLQGCTT
ncbi:PREDICTED: ophiophagus venom factor-like [Branchiostoma belcheri]|uniref:Ophiophagus venom factor-like n=1 Tax=Branchiostoma belcheri TaxID=7741 RepID=A0A6P4Z6E8_BRABE|nr:PREDICTED: ophiophagus venom factor-like [Branchiostoma belcheri]